MWALVPILSMEEDNIPVIEFQLVKNSSGSSGVVEVEVPISKSVSISLLTATVDPNPKQGLVFDVKIFGSSDLQTFALNKANTSSPQISPGILPPNVASMILSPPSSKLHLILGAVLGPVCFLLLLLAFFLFYRRRRARARAREQLRQEHELYRCSPPDIFTWCSAERDSGRSTVSSSVPLAQDPLRTHPTHISPALALRATAAPSSFGEAIIKSPNSLRTFPSSSVSPKRALSATSDSKPVLDHPSQVERAIARLQNKAKQLQSQSDSGDRDTVEGIEDEVRIIQVLLEMERLKRLPSSDAQGSTEL